jgi:aryl-alcohol dehydrogenase-like predicted oxidoreductase
VTLQTRLLGSTRLPVTPIGLGLAALGRPHYINLGRDQDLGADRSVAAMERRCHDVLDAAHRAGVRYVDAARSYGLAEAFLASWLNALTTRDIPTVGSKWGYSYVGGWRPDAPTHEIKDLSLEALRRQIGESRAGLGRVLALYQIHSATLESGVLDDRRVMEELARLASDGLAIGLTVSGPKQAQTVRRALDVAVDGVNPFQCVQATWNLLEPSVGLALAEAHGRGWGVIVKESLANGRLLTSRADHHLPEFEAVAAAVSATPDALAIAAALANPWADVVLSGAVTPEQLGSNLLALDVRLTSAHIDALASLAEQPDAYWSRRGRLQWA